MSDPLRRRVMVRVQRPLIGDDLAALCREVAAQVELGGATTVHCDAGRLTARDRAIVELVARVALVARRHGATLVMIDPPDHLVMVLDLTGLRDLVEVRRFRGRDVAAGRRRGTTSRSRGRS